MDCSPYSARSVGSDRTSCIKRAEWRSDALAVFRSARGAGFEDRPMRDRREEKIVQLRAQKVVKRRGEWDAYVDSAAGVEGAPLQGAADPDHPTASFCALEHDWFILSVFSPMVEG